MIGSTLAGQAFSNAAGNPLPQYFQPRPSDAGTGYDATSSAASNLGPSDPRPTGLFIPGFNTVGRSGQPSKTNPFATAADPSILATVMKLIKENTTGFYWGFLGEPGVNVLTLNLALDRL